MSEVEDPTPAKTEGDEHGAPMTAAAARRAELALPPDIAADSISGYLRTSLARVRAGESGVLPVVGGLLLISILFQSLNSNFLTAGNLVNLLVQAAVFSLLAMAEIFVLLLGEIDLSVGFVAGIAGAFMATRIGPAHDWSWPLAVAVALLICAGIGLLQGTLITRLGLPSFVVTLAGYLFWQGWLLKILGSGGSQPINNTAINDIASRAFTPTVGWILMLALVGLYGGLVWRRESKRRKAGLVAPPPRVTLLKIAGALAAGVALLLLCNTNRGILVPIRGVPWVVLLVLGVLVIWTFLLGRTKLGRYIYAIGGNAEAARRAGVDVMWVRTLAFVLCSFTAGIAGIVYASRLQSISTAVNGGTLVLYAVAAAVIGGTSLFGGRGKAVHGVLGGIVIAAIDNGMGLVGFTASAQYMVTALVLLAAVIIDALSRRGRVAT
jgi:D-xylose transport system permease protein